MVVAVAEHLRMAHIETSVILMVTAQNMEFYMHLKCVLDCV